MVIAVMCPYCGENVEAQVENLSATNERLDIDGVCPKCGRKICTIAQIEVKDYNVMTEAQYKMMMKMFDEKERQGDIAGRVEDNEAESLNGVKVDESKQITYANDGVLHEE